MKRIALGVACAAILLGAPQSKAEPVAVVDAYQGGFEIYGGWGFYCIMTTADAAANFVFANAIAIQRNFGDATLLNAGNSGWGYQEYGSNTCTNVYGR